MKENEDEKKHFLDHFLNLILNVLFLNTVQCLFSMSKLLLSQAARPYDNLKSLCGTL